MRFVSVTDIVVFGVPPQIKTAPREEISKPCLTKGEPIIKSPARWQGLHWNDARTCFLEPNIAS